MSIHTEPTNIFDIMNLSSILKRGAPPEAPIDDRYRFYACTPLYDSKKRLECQRGTYDETYTIVRQRDDMKNARQIYIDARLPVFVDRAALMLKQGAYVGRIIEPTNR